MQHADSLYRYALSRVKDHHAAEDLVQDCLSAAWQRIETFDGRSSLSTWLIGIMKFKVIDHFRKSKRTPTDQAAGLDESGQDPVDSLFTSKGAWKVDPNHGLEMLATAPDDFASHLPGDVWPLPPPTPSSPPMPSPPTSGSNTRSSPPTASTS